MVQNYNSQALGTMHAQHFLVAERERSIHDSWRFRISGTFVRIRQITASTPEGHILHIAVPTITCSLRFTGNPQVNNEDS